jgi:arabinofuranosyltransferase
MLTGRSWKQSYTWIVALLLAGTALAVRLVAGPRTIDDAYITFRYARNLAGGLGFVYNQGQLVLGTTTPLYTGLMALAWLLGLHNLPAVALAANALADAGTAVLLFWLGRRLSANWPVAVAVGLAWAISPMSVTFAVGGMETSVVILFLVGSFAAHVAGRSRLAAAVMALAVLTRPDALIAAALLLADMGLRPLLAKAGGSLTARLRRLPWAEIAIFVGVLAPWLLFATFYFGSPLPQSVQAKVHAYHLDQFSALIRWIQHLSTPFFEHELFGRFWPAIGLPLYLALYLIGSLHIIRRAGRALPMMIYLSVYVLAFSVANPLIFRWYLAPPLPFYFLGILVGLDAIVTGLAQRLGRARAAAWVSGLVAALLLVASLNAYTLHPDHGPGRPAPEMAWFKLELLYGQAADLVRARMHPGDVVAAGDIGAVGWFTGAPILDTLGLISPEAVPYYPLDPSLLVISYAMSADLIRDQNPDYVITPEVYVRNTLLPAAWFHRQYRLIAKLDTDIYGSDGLLIFERVAPTARRCPAVIAAAPGPGTGRVQEQPGRPSEQL